MIPILHGQVTCTNMLLPTIPITYLSNAFWVTYNLDSFVFLFFLPLSSSPLSSPPLVFSPLSFPSLPKMNRVHIHFTLSYFWPLFMPLRLEGIYPFLPSLLLHALLTLGMSSPLSWFATSLKGQPKSIHLQKTLLILPLINLLFSLRPYRAHCIDASGTTLEAFVMWIFQCSVSNTFNNPSLRIDGVWWRHVMETRMEHYHFLMLPSPTLIFQHCLSKNNKPRRHQQNPWV